MNPDDIEVLHRRLEDALDAAQGATAALADLWRLLGARHQIEAITRLRELIAIARETANVPDDATMRRASIAVAVCAS